MKLIDKIKANKKSILIYSLVVLVSILLKHFPVYTGSVVLLFALFMSRKNIFLKTISFFLIAIASAEILYFLCFHQRITQTILDSIVETNYAELIKMLTSTQILFISIASLGLALGMFFLHNKINKLKNINKIRKILFVCLITLFITDINKIIFKHRLFADIEEDRKTLGRIFYDKYPLVIGDTSYVVMSILSNDKYKIYNNDLILNNSIISHENGSQKNIIIIMGESASSARFGSYGYHVNTTPNMQQIFSQNNACIIKNVHSSAPITRDSVAMTFSFAIPENEKPLFDEKNIIDLAKEAGYKTYWLSSQEIAGLHASKFGYIAKKSDVIKLTKGKDDKLSKLLNIALKDKSKKFIILHMAGSHGPYTNFDDIDKKALSHADEYDLTIHHTDRILNDINHVLKSKLSNYILFYTSDHGEIVNVGHGLRGAKEQYFIPLMILDTGNPSVCEYTESLRNSEGYISGLMNKYIITKILGYKLDDSAIESEKNYDRILDANNNALLFNDIENYR